MTKYAPQQGRIVYLRVSQITPHDKFRFKHGRTTRGHGNDPIVVKKKLLGGYKIHDGDARLGAATRRGQRRIAARIKK